MVGGRLGWLMLCSQHQGQSSFQFFILTAFHAQIAFSITHTAAVHWHHLAPRFYSLNQ